MNSQIWNRLQLVFAQGVATLVGAGKVQSRVLDEEVLDNINRVEPYGFSYRPKPGAQVYLAFPSGDRSYGVALVVGDKRYQLDLQEGEVAIHDDEGNFVALRREGHVEIKAATDVTIDAPRVKITGTLDIDDHVTCGNGVTISGGLEVNGKNVSDTHVHQDSLSQTTTGVL